MTAKDISVLLTGSTATTLKDISVDGKVTLDFLVYTGKYNSNCHNLDFKEKAIDFKNCYNLIEEYKISENKITLQIVSAQALKHINACLNDIKNITVLFIEKVFSNNDKEFQFLNSGSAKYLNNLNKNTRFMNKTNNNNNTNNISNNNDDDTSKTIEINKMLTVMPCELFQFLTIADKIVDKFQNLLKVDAVYHAMLPKMKQLQLKIDESEKRRVESIRNLSKNVSLFLKDSLFTGVEEVYTKTRFYYLVFIINGLYYN